MSDFFATAKTKCNSHQGVKEPSPRALANPGKWEGAARVESIHRQESHVPKFKEDA